MNKKVWLILLVLVIVGFGAYALWGASNKPAKPADQNSSPAISNPDPSNTTYVVEGQQVALVNGRSETPAAPGSSAQVTTTLFGEPAAGDINGDGKPDAAVILVQDPGGSGTFYYVAADIATSTGSQGTNAVLLGDRIAPQNIAIQNGQIVVNYADRRPGEPMSVTPSVGVTKYFVYDGSMLQAAAPIAGPGEHCGGNTTTPAACGVGYRCAPAPGSHLPFGDVGGVCVAN